jgi:hypothetical protein
LREVCIDFEGEIAPAKMRAADILAWVRGPGEEHELLLASFGQRQWLALAGALAFQSSLRSEISNPRQILGGKMSQITSHGSIKSSLCVLMGRQFTSVIPVCDILVLEPAWIAAKRSKYIIVDDRSFCTRKSLSI